MKWNKKDFIQEVINGKKKRGQREKIVNASPRKINSFWQQAE
jgi:hypothetical protein